MTTTAPAKQSPTVRISDKSHKALRELSQKTGEPMQAVLDQAIEQFRRQRFWEEMSAAYAAILADPDAIAEEEKERALWDATIRDGLDPSEVWLNDGSVIIKDERNG